MEPYRYSYNRDTAYPPEKYPVGMGYVPIQTWKNIYASEHGFREGTIFKDLNLEFHGKRGTRA